MAEAVDLQRGDVVLVRGVTTFMAMVHRVSPRRLIIEPCDPSIRERAIRPEQVVTVYRAIGRPRSGPRRLEPSPRQLRLDE